mmetsp:Transcript_6083/g.15683  ORF Transcript_6083/g.15683 Transcript_6083/m.15683 type:complete len:256 (-) Transcript_6083:1070-1837(-)
MGGGRGMITAGPPGELSAGCGGLYIGTGPASPGGAPYCGGRGSAPIICAASAGLVLASAAMAGCIAAPPAMPGGPGSAPPARLGGPGSAGWEWSIQAPPSAVVNCSSLTYLATTVLPSNWRPFMSINADLAWSGVWNLTYTRPPAVSGAVSGGTGHVMPVTTRPSLWHSSFTSSHRSWRSSGSRRSFTVTRLSSSTTHVGTGPAAAAGAPGMPGKLGMAMAGGPGIAGAAAGAPGTAMPGCQTGAAGACPEAGST